MGFKIIRLKTFGTHSVFLPDGQRVKLARRRAIEREMGGKEGKAADAVIATEWDQWACRCSILCHSNGLKT